MEKQYCAVVCVCLFVLLMWHLITIQMREELADGTMWNAPHPKRTLYPETDRMPEGLGLDLGSGAMAEDFTSQKVSAEEAKFDESNPYQDVIQNMGLEADVIASHNKFVKEVQHRTTTASSSTVLSHDNDINPWIGLRRPEYKKEARPMIDARVIPSQMPDQLSDATPFYFNVAE